MNSFSSEAEEMEPGNEKKVDVNRGLLHFSFNLFFFSLMEDKSVMW